LIPLQIIKNRGWSWWESNYPCNYTEKVIETYGFYAGIISQLKKLQTKHAAIFKDFDLSVNWKKVKMQQGL
jgi:hypothetical protein